MLALSIPVGCRAPDAASEGVEADTSLYALVETVDGVQVGPPIGPTIAPAGTFDGSLERRLSVALDATDAAGRASTLGTFSASTTPRLVLLAAHELYFVNVPAAAYFTDPALTYRFRVLLDGREIARSDMSDHVFTVLRWVPNLVVGVKVRAELRPAPAVSALEPASVVAGDAGFALTVRGAGFSSDSAVSLGAHALATTYVSSTELVAIAPADLVAAAGAPLVTVTTLAPGGGASSRALAIDNPTPALAAISPAGGYAGSGELTLTLSGAAFLSGARATYDGAELATTFVSSTELTAVVPAALVTAGAHPVAVTNPSPSRGPSAPLSFAVASPTCTDGVKNGSESDVDCGGSCGSCAGDKACAVDRDCGSGSCLPATHLCSTSRLVFAYTGAAQTFVVPAGVTSIGVKLWGAGGGADNQFMSPAPAYGGAGGFTSATVAVTPGEPLTILVGGGGTCGNCAHNGGWPNGGDGGCRTDLDLRSGGGGGRSAIVRGATQLAVAGGGGGAGMANNVGNTSGGGGGGATGQAGQASSWNSASGGGGSATAGGASGVATFPEGLRNLGGNAWGWPSAAGGGDGYFGGGAGLGHQAGGGGSGYADPSVTGASLLTGTTYTPPRTTDPDYAAGVGLGGPVPCGAGGNGRVVFTYGGQRAVFSYTGATQAFVVPAGVTSVDVKLWAAGGGADNQFQSPAPARGGAGGFAAGTIAVTPGESLTIFVGGGGTCGSCVHSGGWPNGGDAGCRTDYDLRGGGGGGRSAVVRGATQLLVAGGGGGAGMANNVFNTQGGAGGGAAGTAGQASQWFNTSGQPGTATAGGYGGVGYPDGALDHGGSAWGWTNAAGGGDGYFGGAAGMTHQAGGGGSGYAGGPGVTRANMIGANRQTPAASTDPDYLAGVAAGGPPPCGAGGPGRVVLSY